MKKLTATLLATAVATVAMPTFADTGMYVGLKAGKLLTSSKFEQRVVATTGLVDPSVAGVYAGYQITPKVGVELEYVTTGGKQSVNTYEGETSPIKEASNDEKLQNLGLYVTARHEFAGTQVPMYVKGKIGVSQLHYENNIGEVRQNETGKTVTKRTVSDTNLAGGVALGIKPIKAAEKLAVELEYNYLDKDVQSVGFGTQYQF